jgi:protein involved in polysaccharide export with SLBB domain
LYTAEGSGLLLTARHVLICLCLAIAGSSARAQDALYTLQPGDTIEVWTAQEPSLNREVVVRPDGRISLPLAGHLQAAGLTPEQLEAAVVERLRGYFKDDVTLTVMLAPSEEEAQTIYVAGEVAEPGAYPFRPGMTVLHAVSVAGGFPRAEEAEVVDRIVVARGELSLSRRRLSELSIREARIRAELDQRDTLEITPEVASSLDDADAGTIMTQEQSLLEMRSANLARQVATNKRLEHTLASEIAALRAQLDSNQRQIDLTNSQLESVRSLVDKGLSPASRSLEIEISIAELQSAREELQAALTRAESDAAESGTRIPNLISERRAELVAELQEVQREAGQFRSSIGVNERLLSLYANTADIGEAEQGDHSFSVVRTVDGVLQELPASELTQISAGDLIKVTAPLAGSAASH